MSAASNRLGSLVLGIQSHLVSPRKQGTEHHMAMAVWDQLSDAHRVFYFATQYSRRIYRKLPYLFWPRVLSRGSIIILLTMREPQPSMGLASHSPSGTTTLGSRHGLVRDQVPRAGLCITDSFRIPALTHDGISPASMATESAVKTRGLVANAVHPCTTWLSLPAAPPFLFLPIPGLRSTSPV